MSVSAVKRTLAIDLGATNLRVGLVELDGRTARIIDQIKVPTPKDEKALTAAMLRLIDQVISQHPDFRFATAGISACGIIEHDRTAVLLPNLGIKNMQLADLVEKHLSGVKCRVANDANCAALSESTMGASTDVPDSIFVTISSGIGTGFVYDHKLINIAFEGGRLIMDLDAENRFVEAEEYLSGNGIVRLCKLEGLGDHVSGAEFFAKIRAGKPAFLKVYNLWLKQLGLYFGNLQRLFNVDVYVLSGGVMKSQDVFLTDLEKVANGFVHPYPLKPIRFVNAKFGQDAGLMGAASLGFSLEK